MAFVDDIMLFSKGDVDFVNLLFNTLKQLGACFGLEFNLAKSNLFVVRISEYATWVLHSLLVNLKLLILQHLLRELLSLLIHGLHILYPMLVVWSL